MTDRTRANGEGSFYEVPGGWRGAVWVTTPSGELKRKYVYSKDRDVAYAKWIKLQQDARDGAVVTSTPKLREYLARWLHEVVTPSLGPKTAENYAMHVNNYIVPALGEKNLGKLQIRDVRTWLNKLSAQCRCCTLGLDAKRPEKKQKCCAKGQCCSRYLARRTIADARATLRTALTNAITEELITKNVAALAKLPAAPNNRVAGKRKMKPWSVDEARRFLESAESDHDQFYAAYVLILILGLRRGEVLGLTWPAVELDTAELSVYMQLQRIAGKLVHGPTKTEASEDTLPMPDICVSALRGRQKAQDADREAAKQAAKGSRRPAWIESEFVFTTRHGGPVEPRNFHRSFKRRCELAGVRPIPVHGTRHTCSSLLAALDVHPRTAMQILRHSKVEVTMEIYTHVPSEVTRAALKRLSVSLGQEQS